MPGSHADVPFEQLVEVLKPPRSTGRSPLFQVLFNLHSEPAGQLQLSGLEATPMAVDRGTAKFDLSVSLSETAAGLAVSFEYSTDLFLPARCSACSVISQRCWPLSSPARMHRWPACASVLHRLSHAACRRSSLLRQAGEGTLAAAFAAQLQQRAEATAVSASAVAGCSGVSWSYAGLDQRARGVAAALMQHGVHARSAASACGSTRARDRWRPCSACCRRVQPMCRSIRWHRLRALELSARDAGLRSWSQNERAQQSG